MGFLISHISLEWHCFPCMIYACFPRGLWMISFSMHEISYFPHWLLKTLFSMHDICLFCKRALNDISFHAWDLRIFHISLEWYCFPCMSFAFFPHRLRRTCMILSKKWIYGHLTIIIAAKHKYLVKKWKQTNKLWQKIFYSRPSRVQ